MKMGRTLSAAAGAVAMSVMLAASVVAQDAASEPQQATTLLDLSGLASIPGVCCRGDDQPSSRVLAAHDGKTPDEDDRPRLSILTLTDSPEGVLWQPLAIDWSASEQGLPNDLESAAAIPGTTTALVVESGDDSGPFRRIFQVEVALDVPAAGRLADEAQWPVDPHNVEGTAVAQVDDRLVFLYAERAEGDPTTMIRWAELELSPLRFGEFEEAPFTSPAVLGSDDRPVSAMEVSSSGIIYVASAFDSGEDDGPFASTIWQIGRVAGGDGPAVDLHEPPRLIATLDAFKAESLVIVTSADGSEQLFVGTDDENYGGVLRPVPDPR